MPNHVRSTIVIMRDNAGEIKSHEMIQSYEKWKNGPAESAINFIMRLVSTVIAVEGGSGSRQELPVLMLVTLR